MKKFTILALISLISAPVLADDIDLELDPSEQSEPESPALQDEELDLELDPSEQSEPESPTPQDDNTDPQSPHNLFDPDSQIVPGVAAEPDQLKDGRLVLELESDLTLFPLDEENDDSVGEPAGDDPQETDEAQKSDLTEALITSFTYNGSGCPSEHNMQAILTSSKENLLIFFDGFGGSSNEESPRVVRNVCNLNILLNVPSEISVGLVGYQYGGSAKTAETARSTYRTEHFFAGDRGPISSENLTGPRTTDFLLQSKLTSDSTIWSPCSKSDVVRSLRVNTGSTILGAGADMSVYFGWLNLRWRYCDSAASE